MRFMMCSTCTSTASICQTAAHTQDGAGAPRQAAPRRTVNRRDIIVAISAATATACSPARVHAAPDARPLQTFQAALQAKNLERLAKIISAQEADAAWTHVLELYPSNAAALSNRGTIRLQQGRWQAAKDDLQRVAAIEAESNHANGAASTLNNLGNAEGALGEWDAARQHYQQAAEMDSSMESIALASAALAAFETGNDAEAVKTARQLLRRDAEFLDARCALAAFLYASGDGGAAEGEWETLQESQDGLGGSLYNKNTAVARVRNRWPPRATAALQAFVSMSAEGSAQGYDGQTKRFRFGAAAGAGS